ncbi:MAG: DJ-1/PfpI family protein [Xanthomonadales bacterium]|jgi:putative intracellular protease/amidase|nr:DJ-1/PfpI family protein [Xanthomonadales bacterium]
MRALFRSVLLILFAAFALGAAASTPAVSPKVLLVVSSEGRDSGKTRPGFDLEEFAQAWAVLRANGLTVDVASPAGGAVDLGQYEADHDYIQALKADAEAMAALGDTRRTDAVRPGEHAAIFVIGGGGAMFDLPKDAALTALLAAQDASGGVIAAVCHGPAAFEPVRRADGKPLVAGRRVTGFTDEEEAVFGKTWAKEYPYLLEAKLREQGAIWQEAKLMLPEVVVDGRLISGQNPYATPGVAEAIVRALGREPVSRQPFRDEASMQLAVRALAGEVDAARSALSQAPERHLPQLIGILGYYHAQAATDDTARRQALTLMELALPHVTQPRLARETAALQQQLGDIAAARRTLEALLKRQPDDKAAREALAALPEVGASRR